MNYKVVAGIIIRMRDEDLTLRDQLIESGTLEQGYNKEMEQLHNKNAIMLEEIINKIGYPTIDKVGKEANDAAWLVIQHSIGQPVFMKKCLKLLEAENNDDISSKRKIAYLSDRIAAFENRPQLYGTQFDWNEHGDLRPKQFDDLAKVNQRRNSIGLNTLEEQIKIMQDQAKNENRCAPKDLKKRAQEMDDWKRKVGWIE